MGKDLLRDRFGRFYEFPKALAASGHQVRAVCLKYRRDQCSTQPLLEDTRIEWTSHDLGWNWPVGFLSHYRRLAIISQSFAPHVIVGASDSMHVIMAAALAKNLAVPLAVDLYDNFESYRATQVPGVKAGLVWAIKNAAAISVVSDPLNAMIRAQYRPGGSLTTITNAACSEIFYPYEKALARVALGLPREGVLIGTAGALSSGRGIETLYAAYQRLSVSLQNAYLVLAGPRDGWLPSGDRIIYLGELPQRQIGTLFGALDVGVICNRASAFGKYCFPQKFYEMLACRLPIVAADVGVMGQLLRQARQFLYEPGSPASLIDAVMAQLRERYIPTMAIPSWAEQGRLFEAMLARAVARVEPVQDKDQLNLDEHPGNSVEMDRCVL